MVVAVRAALGGHGDGRGEHVRGQNTADRDDLHYRQWEEQAHLQILLGFDWKQSYFNSKNTTETEKHNNSTGTNKIDMNTTEQLSTLT